MDSSIVFVRFLFRLYFLVLTTVRLQQSVPPVMAFHLGSLGFLTPFLFDNFQEKVTNVLEGNGPKTFSF